MRYPARARPGKEHTLLSILTPPRYRALLARAVAVLALFSAALPCAAQRNEALPVATIKVGSHALRVEVASTPEQVTRGLMFREKLGRNDGMLFVYWESSYLSMWMKNTLIPLSVAFLDAEGRILNIADMAPQTLDSHMSAGPARYAVETNQGWFAERGIKPGDRVTGIPKVPR
jgi:uncharacterized membrane protein (UPF0127 family)